MRRALLGIVVVAMLAAGCGSASTPAAPANPLASALGYFPFQAPLVASIQTGSHATVSQAITALQARFPALALVRTGLISQLSQQGIDYSTDIKPLFGNPITFGTTGSSFTGAGSSVLLVWVTHSADKLNALIHKIHKLHGDGSHGGASLYSEASGTEVAVLGPTVVVARSRTQVIAALDRHTNGSGLTAAQHAADIQGLDPHAAIQLFGDIQDALSSPGATKAKRIPWVAALRSYGVALGVSPTGVTFGFRFNTNGSVLAANQIPIASGTSAPPLVAGLPIQVGIRDPAQILNFVLSAMQASSAHGYATFLRDEARIRARTGLDLRSFLATLSGNMVIDSDTHTTLARVGVGNPSLAARTLAKLAAARGQIPGSDLTRVSPGVYSFPTSHRRALLGLVGSQLVLAVPPKGGTLSPSTLHAFAGAASTPAPGAGGSVAFRVGISQLVALSSSSVTQSPTVRAILNLLGDLTGSMSATSSALTGTATLAFK